ncbi:GAF domain-containing protein [Sneathiella glossodoripedis]|uniref:GAF domain-containing protein n=1 Tax=Sneathiella glossodoripedis TaxID=418853 RepID=UPI000683DB47|nr:GAF domain-containing protein [Sneathiella glossodoripedis]
MAALPLNTSACVTLSVVSDDPLCAEQLLSFLTDPAISVSNAIVTETGMLPSLSVQSDVVLLIVNSPDIAPVIAGIKTAKVLRGTLKILVLDRSPTVERAVEFMKCGVSDYTEFHEDKAGEHAVRVEQACLDILFDIPEPAVLRGSNKPPEILSLHRKVQKVVRAAKELSSCRTLQAVCERLLETVGDALGATGGSLYLQDGNILRRAHTLDPGHAPEILELPLPTGSLFEQVYSSKEPLIISESSELPGEYSSGWQGYQGESVLVYPLVERSGELIGLFSLHGKKRDIFTKDDRDLVLILAAYSLETIRALLVQERLQEAFNSLSMTFENMSEGIILLDEERRIVQCNQNVARILRLSEDELASGTSIVELCSSLYARGDSTEKANGENPWDAAAGDFSYEHYCNDGAVIRFSGKLLENGANVLTISDITAQKNWETELCLAKDKAEAANASKTNFLANISMNFEPR